MDGEEDRRARLRAFLIERRSRLTPEDVGLPHTGRRRVAGLRREEVAELAGVSSDWYRWFESGRPIRVSPPFLSRLADALRLGATDRRAMFRLALPELYEAEIAQMPLLGLISPVLPGDEIGKVLRKVARGRDAFLAHDSPASWAVRPRIARSWERSLALGADPARQEVPAAAESCDALAERRDSSRRLLEAADPILLHLRNILEDSGFALVTADASACILEMSGDRDVLRALSRINFEPGGDLSENAVGTNAVGTAVTDQRPLQLIGAENFCEGGSDLTCTAAPIRDPATHRICGVLDVTGNSRLICPEMITIIGQAAIEIEEQLAELHAGTLEVLGELALPS